VERAERRGVSAPHVVVVGGGLAGLAAAIACQDAGVRITLLESRARLGGATWSTERRGLVVDNGQHVFLRCCTAYLAFLERLGVADDVVLQERLAVPVREPGGRTSWIRRAPLPAPAHLAPSLLRFAPLSLSQRVRAARTVLKLRALDLADPALDARRFGDWLRAAGESDAAIDGFWDLLIRPTLNRPAREASLALATKVFQTGLLTEADGADVGWSAVPLQALHADPAERILREAGGDVRRRCKVTRLEPAAGDRHAAVWVGSERIAADAVILAVPHDAAAELLPAGGKVDPEALAALGHSPILNLHVVFDRRVLELPFVAAIGSPLQWVFDRTASSGLNRGQYLAVSISAADEYEGLSIEELRTIFVRAFHELLPASRAAQIADFFVTREPMATFRQVPGTKPLRAGADSGWPGLSLAGAWTDTGWPATMEGAVRSGFAAAQRALGNLRHDAAR
jgi:squalene-associated FAD-dependent desaturase